MQARLAIAVLATAAVAVGVGFDWNEAQAAKAPVAGKVTFYRGNVMRASSAEGPWKKLKRNRKFFRGDVIKTGDGSRVELKFVDRSIVRLGAETTLELHEAFFSGKGGNKKVSAVVKAGRAWANVNKFVGGKNAFDLRSDNAVAGVRGTIFSLARSKDGGTKVSVFGGSVAVDNSPWVQALRKRSNSKPAHRRTNKAPIAFGSRKEVSLGLREISKKQWEQMVGKHQTMAIAADGKKSEVASFDMKDALAGVDGEWIKWNQGRDSGSGIKH
jgi:hypothetical protein